MAGFTIKEGTRTSSPPVPSLTFTVSATLGPREGLIRLTRVGAEAWISVDPSGTYAQVTRLVAEVWFNFRTPATGLGVFQGRAIGPVGLLGVPPRKFRDSETFGTTDPGAHPSVSNNAIPDDRYGLGPVGLLGIPVRKFRERQDEFKTTDPGAHPSVGNNVLPDDRFGLGPAGLLGVPVRKFRETGFSEPYGPSPVGPKSYPLQVSQLSAEVWVKVATPTTLWVTQTTVEAWLVNPPTVISSVSAFLWVD